MFENVSVDAVTGTVSYRTMPLSMASRDAVPEAEHHVRAWMQASLKTATGPSAEKVLGCLAKGLAGMLPGARGKVGTALLGFLMPSNEGIDYQQLLDDIGTTSATPTGPRRCAGPTA